MIPRKIRAVRSGIGWAAEIELEDDMGFVTTFEKPGFSSKEEAYYNALNKSKEIIEHFNIKENEFPIRQNGFKTMGREPAESS